MKTIAEVRRRSSPCAARAHRAGPDDGRRFMPGMRRCSRRRGRKCELVVASIFVNPAQFGDPGDLDATRARSKTTSRALPAAESTSSSLPARRSFYPPGSRPGSSRQAQRSASKGVQRPGHFRGVATVCVKLFAIVAPTSPTSGARTPSRSRSSSRSCATSTSTSKSGWSTGPRPRRPRALLAQRPALAAGAAPRAAALPRRSRPAIRLGLGLSSPPRGSSPTASGPR